MKQHQIKSNLDSREVISFLYSNLGDKLPKTFTISTLQQALSSMFENRYAEDLPEAAPKQEDIYVPDQYEKKIEEKIEKISQNWWQEGFKCEVLKLGSHDWQRGKVRLKATIEIEFIPEEGASVNSATDDNSLIINGTSENSASTLDDIRNSVA